MNKKHFQDDKYAIGHVTMQVEILNLENKIKMIYR